MIEEMENYQRIMELEKEKKECNREYKKTVESMSNRIAEIEKEHHNKLAFYQKQVKDLNIEVSALDNYKKENLRFHYMLFNLYNQLIERLKLDKNLSISKELLNIEEKDFNPNLFDNSEIVSYIKAMLISSSNEKSSKVLREVIAYSNMMLRIYLKDQFKESKFNPVQIFKNIMKFIEDLQIEKYNNEHHMIRLEDKIKILTKENKKYLSEIKFHKIKFESTEKKLFSQFNDRIEKSRHNRNLKIMSGNFNSEYSRQVTPKNLLNKQHKISNKDLSLNRPKTARNIIQNSDYSQKETFVTNDNKNIFKDLERFDTTIETENKIDFTQSLKIDTGNMRHTNSPSYRPKTGVTKRPHNYFFKSSKIKNKLINEVGKNKEEEEIFKIKPSKLNQNLEMIGSFPDKSIFKNDLNNFVHHTNRLFLYKDNVKKYSQHKIEKGTKFIRFTTKMDNAIKKIDNVTRKKSFHLEEKIDFNIQNLIKKIEKS